MTETIIVRKQQKNHNKIITNRAQQVVAAKEIRRELGFFCVLVWAVQKALYSVVSNGQKKRRWAN